MTYSLVVKHCGRWYTHITDSSMSQIDREIDWLNNTEYPPSHMYVIGTDSKIEPIQETVGRFVHSLDPSYQY